MQVRVAAEKNGMIIGALRDEVTHELQVRRQCMSPFHWAFHRRRPFVSQVVAVVRCMLQSLAQVARRRRWPLKSRVELVVRRCR